MSEINNKDIKYYFNKTKITYETAKLIGNHKGYIIFETQNYIIKVKNYNCVDLLQFNKDDIDNLKHNIYNYGTKTYKKTFLNALQDAYDDISDNYIIIKDKQTKVSKPYKAITTRNHYINIRNPFLKRDILLSQFLGFLKAGFLILSIPKKLKIEFEIDHKDRNIYNNEFDNLRVVSRSENQKNKFNKKSYKNKKEAEQAEINHFHNNIIDPVMSLIFGPEKWEYLKNHKEEIGERYKIVLKCYESDFNNYINGLSSSESEYDSDYLSSSPNESDSEEYSD